MALESRLARRGLAELMLEIGREGTSGWVYCFTGVPSKHPETAYLFMTLPAPRLHGSEHYNEHAQVRQYKLLAVAETILTRQCTVCSQR
jgi:hypothetical protein